MFDLALMQFGSDTIGTIIWFLLFFVLIFVYPRLMLSQLIMSLEKSAVKLEELSENANSKISKKITNVPDKRLKTAIKEFTDFFVISPSNLDPYGIVKKIDTTVRQMEDRFQYFVDSVVKDKNESEKNDINYSLRAAIGLRQMAKIVRHYVEMSKKFKNLQMAMIIKMQLPIIEELAKSEYRGVEAFLNQWPVGDSVGPLTTATIMKEYGQSKPMKIISEDVAMGEVVIEGRKAFLLKATGPSPHLGRMDYAINKIMKSNNIERVITIDAGLKLEGEKSGEVSEGVGFAMGGWSQREMIENVLLTKQKPLDSIVVKVGMEEAISPMRKNVYDAVPKTIEYVKNSIRRSKKNGKVMIIGVGNSCAIPDDPKKLDRIKELVDMIEKEAKEKEVKKKSWFKSK